MKLDFTHEHRLYQQPGGAGSVSSVFTRHGDIVAQPGDYTAAQVTNAVDKTQFYNNPTWINSLDGSKITNLPAPSPYVAQGVSLPNANSAWQNQTITVLIPAAAIMAYANTWQVTMVVASGSTTMHVQGMTVRRNPRNNLNATATVVVTSGGLTSFNLPVGETYSDAIAVPLAGLEDIYISVFLDNVAGNAGSVGSGYAASQGCLTWFTNTGDVSTGTFVNTGAVHATPVLINRFIWVS